VNLVEVGFAIAIAWPAYHVLLIAVTLRDAKRARRGGDRPATAASPEQFWIIIPCLNEERVVGRTVRSALALAGPPGTRSRVLVVDDGSDDGTPAALAAIDNPDLVVLRRDLPEARRGKGEALNAAYRYLLELTQAEGPTRTASRWGSSTATAAAARTCSPRSPT
jgi:cellulose synthase/poly-beta-1,6-N-acetylglucosamine synthase-like glycosyltransferase